MVFEKIGKYIYFKLETDRIVYLLLVNNVPGMTLRMGTTSDRLAYSGSYKVGFSTHTTFFLKLLQNQAQTTAF